MNTDTNQNLVLSDAEVESLTGYKQPAAQIRALRKMGLNPFVRPDGRPSVMAAAVVHVQTAAPRRPSAEPRFEKAA